MKTLIKNLSILLIFCISGTLELCAQTDINALEFIENKGQWDSKITYKGVLTNGAFFLRKTGFTVVQHSAEDLTSMGEALHGKASNSKLPEHEHYLENNKGRENNILHSHAYNMDFVGANEKAIITPDKVQPGYNNYFIGNEPSKWVGNCGLFQAVTYKNVYPGIDVRYYSEAGNLKYEFIVNPGADPSRIAMKFEGVDKLGIVNNELIVKTSVGEVRELYPLTYQFVGTERRKIDCRYEINGNVVKFKIRNFSRESALVIDPTLIFASFTGSTADNWGYTATYANDGSFYAGGIVFETGFPTSPGAYKTNYLASGVSEANFWNMGIMKFSSNGSQRLYATYVGGSQKDQPHSLFADAQGNLVIAGRTQSPNYPEAPGGAFGPKGAWDIVITKLSSAGNALLGSVRIGGDKDDGFNTADSHNSSPRDLLNNYGDDARSEVILDAAGNREI